MHESASKGLASLMRDMVRLISLRLLFLGAIGRNYCLNGIGDNPTYITLIRA